MRGLTQATISSLFLLPLILATRYAVIYEEDDQLAAPTDQPNLLNLLGGTDLVPPYEGVIENTVYVPPHLVGRQGCEYCNGSSSTPVCCVSSGDPGVQYCCSATAVCTTARWCCPAGAQACPNGAIGACAGEGDTCCGRTVCKSGQTCCGRVCCGSNQVCSDGYCLPRTTSSTSTNSRTSTTTTSSTTTSSTSTSTSTTTTTTSSTSTSSTSVSSDTNSSSSISLPQDPSTPNETSTSTPIDEPSTPSPSVNDPSTPVADPSTPVTDPSTSVNDPSPTVDDPAPTVDDPTLTVSGPSPSIDDPSIPPSDTIPPTQPVDPPTNTIDAVSSDTIVDSSALIQGTPPVDPPAPSQTGPASSSVPASDSPQIFPFVATADVNPSSSTPNVPIDSPIVTQETIVSSGSTLTVSRTVLPNAVLPSSSSSGTAANDASVSGSDAVAYVYPWDPRIQYDPEDAWVSTSSSSSVGNCHNGTKVSSTPGSSIKFGFEGKQIALLICNGSKGGNYTVQVDGSPASTYSSWKDPTVAGSGGDECIISQPFTSNVLQDGQHNITVIVKGSLAGTTTQQGQVEFGGFIYRGPRAVGTRTDSKPNLAVIGGAIGGVIGGVAIITLIVVLVILRRRRRNQRVDNSPAVDNLPPAPPTFTSAPTYTPVPTTEYHDPYANSGYGPQYYPNPTGQTTPGPSWRQTDEGPFGSGSYASPGVVPPSMQAGYAR